MEPQPTPTDELTGIPLPIIPQDDDVLLLLEHPKLNNARRFRREQYADWNHAYHPKNAQELADPRGRDERDIHGQLVVDPEGGSVRDCRGQLVMRTVHRDYHNAYSGPPLPQTTTERLQAVIFNVGGYIPRQAMDFSGDSPAIVNMSDDQIHRLQTSGEVRPMRLKVIRKFLEHHVLSSPATNRIEESLVDEFLSIKPEEEEKSGRRRALARKLLTHSIDQLTEPLVTPFAESRRQGLWKPDNYYNPRHVVHNVIVGQDYYPRLTQMRRISDFLFKTLSQQREETTTAA